MRSSISFEPETLSYTLPESTTTIPATATADCFIVNPFFVIAACNCFRVAVLLGFILTAASPFARLSLTESTPDTDFNDTLTACAQTSQSMPKIVMSIDLISADAEVTPSNKTDKNAIGFFISSPGVNVGTADN
jgi:hypothetical protein